MSPASTPHAPSRGLSADRLPDTASDGRSGGLWGVELCRGWHRSAGAVGDWATRPAASSERLSVRSVPPSPPWELRPIAFIQAYRLIASPMVHPSPEVVWGLRPVQLSGSVDSRNAAGQPAPGSAEGARALAATEKVQDRLSLRLALCPRPALSGRALLRAGPSCPPDVAAFPVLLWLPPHSGGPSPHLDGSRDFYDGEPDLPTGDRWPCRDIRPRAAGRQRRKRWLFRPLFARWLPDSS